MLAIGRCSAAQNESMAHSIPIMFMLVFVWRIVFLCMLLFIGDFILICSFGLFSVPFSLGLFDIFFVLSFTHCEMYHVVSPIGIFICGSGVMLCYLSVFVPLMP